MINLIPLESLTLDHMVILHNILLISIVVFILSVFFSILCTGTVTAPIQKLVEKMKSASAGKLNISASYSSNDELAVLYNQFNLMMQKIQTLLNDIYEEQNAKQKMEIRLLQSQINPHFLYNTLDSIVWMAEGGNNRQVVEMTTDLSDFFRTVLSGGKDFITVEEEESHIRSYLKIQKIRYEDILDYSIQIEPGIKDHIVLKMLLQPLVENALYHGIKNKRGGGCIIIRGYEDRDNLIFEVEDNGSGMDPETLEKVRKKLSGTFEGEQADLKKGGFGLNNVAQRLRMYYGDQAEILVESEKGIGTCFKIFLNKKT
mgnify:CR=1 FL=1